MHCTFEKKLQWECLQEAIKIIRSGDRSRENVILAVQHLACFVGCGAELLLPDDGPIGAVPSQDISTLADELEQLIPAEGAAAALPWMQIIQIVIALMLELFKETEE